jgi:hypothetical protein
MRLHRIAVLLAATLTAPRPGIAQGLPPHRPLNPVIASRSGLGFIPLVELGRAWKVDLGFDYGSLVEVATRPPASLTLDTEVMRLDVTVTRAIGRTGFLQVRTGIGGASGGFLDEAINGYHGIVGFGESVREGRPDNVFDYSLVLPDGTTVTRTPSGSFLGDLALTAGLRHAPRWQTALTLTLPSGTGPEGFTKARPAAAVTTTVRSELLWDRLTLEGSAGLGYTPVSGDLAAWQRTIFLAGSGGARFRFWGRQSIYANLLFHSAPYHDTTIPALDRADASLDFGFLLKPGSGPEIVAGMVEDLYVFGPAVDLIFRVGLRW